MADEQVTDIDQALQETAAAEPAQQPEPVSPQPVPPEQQPTPQAAAAPSPPAWRQVAQEVGFTIPEGVDEKELFKQVYTGYQRGQQAQQYLQQVTPYWSEFQNFLKERQAQQQPKAQAQEEEKPWYAKWHQPPEFDDRWRSQITKDLDGNLIPAPGAPPDVVQRYLAYENYRQKLADKFTANPYEFIQDPVKHLAREEAKAVFAELQREQQEQQFVQQTVNDPAMAWVHQRDDKGGIVRDLTGKPQFTPLGQMYNQALEELYQAGMPVHLQHRYALAQVQAAYAQTPEYAASLAKQPAKQDQNEAFHAKHEHTPNMAAILPGPAQGVTPPVTGQYTDERDLFAKALKDYTDDDIKLYVAGRQAG